jgi:hypothetical protein
MAVPSGKPKAEDSLSGPGTPVRFRVRPGVRHSIRPSLGNQAGPEAARFRAKKKVCWEEESVRRRKLDRLAYWNRNARVGRLF